MPKGDNQGQHSRHSGENDDSSRIMIYLAYLQKYLVCKESATSDALVIADNPLFYSPSVYEVKAFNPYSSWRCLIFFSFHGGSQWYIHVDGENTRDDGFRRYSVTIQPANSKIDLYLSPIKDVRLYFLTVIYIYILRWLSQGLITLQRKKYVWGVEESNREGTEL